MADCILNITDDSQVVVSESRTTTSAGSQTSLAATTSSLTATVISKPKTSSKLAKAHRWYLQEPDKEAFAAELTLVLDDQHRPPVKIDASKKSTTWNIPLPPDHEEGAFYDVVLGVSVQDLKIDCIESILLRFNQSKGAHEGYENEMIRADQLKNLSSKGGLGPDDKEIQEQEGGKDGVVLRWKLFFRCRGYEGGLTITMLVNSWTDLPHEYGSLDLHFVELCTGAPVLYSAEPLYREHRPYASWLVDLNHSACAEYSALTNKMKSCTNFSLSGDGRFATIKTIAGAETYLEVWSLKDSGTARKPPVVSKGKGDSPDVGDGDALTQHKITPHSATPVAWMPLSDTDFDVSISWDGSLLALIDRTRWDTDTDSGEDATVPRESEFAVFHCSWDDTKASDTSSSRMSLVRYDVQRTCPGLKNCLVEGMFHMVDKSNPDPKDQLFITCNGVTSHVYSAFEAWTPLRSIVLDSTITSMDQAPDLGEILFNRTRGRYLITGNESTAFTFDIVQGILVSFSSALGQEELRLMNYFSALSEDGSLIAIPGFRHVNVYRTRTWTLHGSYEFNEIASDERVLHVSFLSNASLLLVKVVPLDNILGQTRPGYVLDVATMSLVDRMAPDGCDYLKLASLDGTEQGLVYVGYSQLWDMRLEDRTYQCGQKYPTRCTDLCKDPEHSDSGVQEGTSSSGLHFKVQRTDGSASLNRKRDRRSTITVTMTAKDGSQVKKMAVPIPDGDSIRSAAFHADFKFLLVVTTTLNMAWTLPTTFDGEFALHVLLYAPYILDWMICHHGFMRYRHDEDVQEFQLAGYITHPISDRGPSEAFIVGVGPILGFYELANSRLRQDIVRLYASQINCSFGESQFNIIEILSACWRPEYHHVFCDFLKSLLAVPGTRWVPPPDMSVALNPLAKLLDAAATQPLANAAAQIVIDYCLRQAKKEQDPQFLVPIRQCLHLLVDPKQQYSEMALNIYREMAYLPSQSRDFIIGHHSLANPLEPRWAFWRHYPWGLHQYKDQVMQLETVKIPNPPKGNFTREIFQASFDMLWTKPEAEEEESQDDTEESKKNDHVRKLYSWPRTIWTMVLRKCRLKYNTTIECYPFELEALDNPALMALVEYKWNTIGFSYWLVRFLGQLCYYTLVLTAVFLQIYGENRVTDEGVLISDPGPEGLYIAIIVIAFTFLWLELGQFVKQKRDYIRSVYNLVDFGVFLLPLIGAINQILIIHGAISVGTNPAVLSFSVLLVFLHFLFELRVFQAVCHFVSIIIRAIYSIRVFIFVFSGGLLAFAIAILHLMHTCVSAEECVYFTEGFSNNLFRALSVTYFMMGGNYDPVETGFTSDSFSFHAMMVVFFFFTVIVMLNVLIALINNAIDDGDQTWQLDWLEYRMRYVESAENMSYDIPGFREKHNYFPDTIYYTGTSQQVREYERKTKQMMEGESVPEATVAPVIMTTTSVAVVAPIASDKIDGVLGKDVATDTKVAQLVETELRKQLETEREKSDKQIGELQHQLKDQEQMLREQQQMLAQILAKLER